MFRFAKCFKCSHFHSFICETCKFKCLNHRLPSECLGEGLDGEKKLKLFVSSLGCQSSRWRVVKFVRLLSSFQCSRLLPLCCRSHTILPDIVQSGGGMCPSFLGVSTASTAIRGWNVISHFLFGKLFVLMYFLLENKVFKNPPNLPTFRLISMNREESPYDKLVRYSTNSGASVKFCPIERGR